MTQQFEKIAVEIMWSFFLVTVAIIVSYMASGILVLYFRVYQTDELHLMLKKKG